MYIKQNLKDEWFSTIAVNTWSAHAFVALSNIDSWLDTSLLAALVDIKTWIADDDLDLTENLDEEKAETEATMAINMDTLNIVGNLNK